MRSSSKQYAAVAASGVGWAYDRCPGLPVRLPPTTMPPASDGSGTPARPSGKGTRTGNRTVSKGAGRRVNVSWTVSPQWPMYTEIALFACSCTWCDHSDYRDTTREKTLFWFLWVWRFWCNEHVGLNLVMMWSRIAASYTLHAIAIFCTIPSTVCILPFSYFWLSYYIDFEL